MVAPLRSFLGPRHLIVCCVLDNYCDMIRGPGRTKDLFGMGCRETPRQIDWKERIRGHGIHVAFWMAGDELHFSSGTYG